MSPKKTQNKIESVNSNEEIVKPNIHDIEWTDYVLGLLSEDEKISGNPTTDGLRRVFESVMNCRVIGSTSQVIQSPDPNNEKRATVVHKLTFCLNSGASDPNPLYTIEVDGSADVYWGNCDKIYRNHPVAVAETRAEGRALRRALRLRKVVAAEEISKEIEDNPDGESVNKISNNQLNFIDVLSKRLDINVNKMLEHLGYNHKNIYNIEHSDAINIIKTLSSYQQDPSSINADILEYDSNWK
jgi:hypothetical protein